MNAKEIVDARGLLAPTDMPSFKALQLVRAALEKTLKALVAAEGNTVEAIASWLESLAAAEESRVIKLAKRIRDREWKDET